MLTLLALNGKTLTMTVTQEAGEMDGEEADVDAGIAADMTGDVEEGKQMTASLPKTNRIPRRTLE